MEPNNKFWREIIDNFYASFAGIKNNEASGIRDILSKVPKVVNKTELRLSGKDLDLLQKNAMFQKITQLQLLNQMFQDLSVLLLKVVLQK